jgi:hypothetical protein
LCIGENKSFSVSIQQTAKEMALADIYSSETGHRNLQMD